MRRKDESKGTSVLKCPGIERIKTRGNVQSSFSPSSSAGSSFRSGRREILLPPSYLGLAEKRRRNERARGEGEEERERRPEGGLLENPLSLWAARERGRGTEE